MRRHLLADWFHENGRELAIDLALAAAVIWLVLVPPRDRIEVVIQAAIVTGVLLRAFTAWRDWRYAPQNLNHIWYRLGRDAGTRTIDKVARIYRLEKPESIHPFDGELGDALLHARQDLPARCGFSAPRGAIDVVADSVHGFWIPIDRSHTLAPPGLRMEVADPIPDAAGFTAHFDDVCLARAEQILDEDREIAVFWSGGIDSTTALSALLMQAAPADRARLHVFLRPRSIGEYPEFFAAHVRDLPHTVITGHGANAFQAGPSRTFSSDVGPVLGQQASEKLVVTGEHGDQVFGSIKLAENPEWIGQPPDRYLNDPAFDGFRDDIERLNAACPVPIGDIDTMLWWWNFAVKWQEISYRSLADLRDPSSFRNIRHFFQTDDFQKWSIANPDLKIRDSLASYKWPAKDFIYAFAGDADYRDHKVKVGSLRVRIGSVLAIDNHHNIIRAGQTSTDEQKIRAKYGASLGRFVIGDSPLAATTGRFS
ncbi:MAG: hypothetical protein QF578_17200 [Alphaproteobacteria bacterium]|jgi:hypothetical protein|nr:hypothetical protein [Alphaproteobacteria bacterium]MDP6566567.1 hypothetical protein [Alphaproteobacteria bacterium]MDP6813651.1 hypothetical protein [Alphaproteobacteria bacterium]